MRRSLAGGLVVGAVAAIGPGAFAQAPLNATVALQPPKGVLILEQKLRADFGHVPSPQGQKSAQRLRSSTSLVFGVTETVTGIVSLPLMHVNSDGPGNSEFGVADIRVLAKIRLYREDLGPLQTRRFALVTGVEIPSGDDPFTSDSVDPIIGGVYSHIADRHAVHLDALWRFGTGSGIAGDDTLFYDATYVYRLEPDEYAGSNPRALFGVVEFNGRYDTNGDHELVFSPGLALATRDVVIGANVQIPVHRSVDQRFERNVGFGLTLRFRF